MGISKNIKTPEYLLKLFDDYVKYIKDNPIKVNDWVGGAGKKIVRVKEKPLTMVGFENYCFRQGIINDLKDYFSNKEGRYKDFAPICSRIRGFIEQDQIEGGMAGIYSTSITQRLNGLVEKAASNDTLKIEMGESTNGIST